MNLSHTVLLSWIGMYSTGMYVSYHEYLRAQRVPEGYDRLHAKNDITITPVFSSSVLIRDMNTLNTDHNTPVKMT